MIRKPRSPQAKDSRPTHDAVKGAPRRIGVLAEPAALREILSELQRLDDSSSSELLLIIPVPRFRAPGGTAIAYRRLAHLAAKEINQRRAIEARNEASAVLEAFKDGFRSCAQEQVLFEPTADEVASVISERGIDLLVCGGKVEARLTADAVDMSVKLSRMIACPILVVPAWLGKESKSSFLERCQYLFRQGKRPVDQRRTLSGN